MCNNVCFVCRCCVVWLSVTLNNALRQNAAFNDSRLQRSIGRLRVWPARSHSCNLGYFVVHNVNI